jgi:hypothetical protein
MNIETQNVKRKNGSISPLAQERAEYLGVVAPYYREKRRTL